MASLGIVLLAGISYIVIITLISGNASEYSENEILRRLEVIEELNSDLKIENARLRLNHWFTQADRCRQTSEHWTGREG